MNIKRLLAVLAALLTAAVLAPGVFAQGPNITFTTEPSDSDILPDYTLSTVRIAVLDEQGNPIPNVKIGFDLKAPSPGLFFSTDFPVVEGTDLMNFEFVADGGVLEFDYLWPIRGSYEVALSAAPTAQSPVQFAPISDTREFSLSENPEEWTNLIVLIAILAVFGLISGLVLGGSLKTRREPA